MTKLAKFLRAKEPSTPSHAVRAEERLKAEANYRRLLDNVMQELG